MSLVRVWLFGGEVKISEEDNKPHLDETAAKTLLLDALNIYRDEHHHQPAQIVVYKTSSFNEAERAGFKTAIDEKEIDFYRLFSMSRSFIRLYRDGYFPPLRGTWVELDDSRFVLYTKGTVPFYEMYPGPYIPRTLSVRKEVCDASTEDICREILALTKMNWNNTQLDGFEPLPLRAAREVGAILKYCCDSDSIATFYRHHM
jgi:argonaute-like protein implicated in RNA metabolism and viral defense